MNIGGTKINDMNLEGLNIDDFFALFYNNSISGCGYGAVQNPFENLKRFEPDYYDYIKRVIMDKYNLTNDQADFFINKIEYSPTCTYASCVNDVMFIYKDNPELFEETFGYPLYRVNNAGLVVLNDVELLVDYIVTSCSYGNANTIIKIDENGNTTFNPGGYLFGDLQCVTPGYPGISEFFKIKTQNSSLPINFTVDEKFNFKSNYSYDEMGSIIDEYLNNGDIVTLGFCPIGASYSGMEGALYVPMIDTNGNYVVNLEGGHWVTITNTTKQGIIVSSWGERFLITYDQLRNNAVFNVFVGTRK